MGAIIRRHITGIILVTMVYWLVTAVASVKATGSFATVLGYVMIAICVVILCMSQYLKGGASGQTQESGGSGPSSSPSEPNGSVESDRIQ